MLSEEEQLKIKEEEIYRQEIIKSLQPKRTKSQKVIDFFNSSLRSTAGNKKYLQ